MRCRHSDGLPRLFANRLKVAVVADDPWTKCDPQPGDFDEDLRASDPRFVEHHAGDPEARLRKIRATGNQIVDDHAEAMELLADYDSEEDV